MYCKNCGNKIKDTEKFCTVCGTPVDEKIGEQGKSAWKKAGGEGGGLTRLLKGRNRMLLIVCAAVLAVAIPCIANSARINNFFHRTFSSPEKYFQFVEKKALSEAVDLVGGYYSDIISRMEFYDTSYSGEVTLEPGEDMLRLIRLASQFFDLNVGVDLSEIESLKVGADISVKDSVMDYGLTTVVNNVNLLSANAVMDMNRGELYAQIPELTKTYIGMEVEGYIGDLDELLEYQSINRAIMKALPKQAEVEELVRRYLIIVLQNIDKVSIGRKKELYVEGIDQKCTELEVTIDGAAVQKVMQAVLEEALEDGNLEKIIVAIMNAVGEDGAEVYDELAESMEDMLDDIEDLADDDTEMKLTVYVDQKGNIIGNVLGEKTQWGENSFGVLTAKKGNNIAYEISNVSYVSYGRESLEISGKGKNTGDLLTGDFRMKVNGYSALEMKVMELDIEKLKRGYVNGKVEIMLSSELSRELSNEIDVPVISDIIEKSGFLLDCKSSAQSLECKVTWNCDGEKFLDVMLTLKSGDGSKAAIPDGNSVIMIEDEDDIMDYYDEIDWDKLLTGLEKTGAFSEAVERLEDIIDNLDDLNGLEKEN